ncbi:MAG: tetratricopeptide repeat protein [Nitrospirota bacterium]|nr:tetratricopeptide repeat protein [Nitrospirota bacterium]
MTKFYLIGIFTLSLAVAGCAIFPGAHPGSRESAEALQVKHASELATAGNFTGAIDAYRKIMQDHPNSPESAFALYGIAMVYVSADNQQKDYAQSLAKLDEFITQYPNHELTNDARNWRHAIKAILDARRENDRLNKNIERLKQLDMRQEEKRMGR